MLQKEIRTLFKNTYKPEKCPYDLMIAECVKRMEIMHINDLNIQWFKENGYYRIPYARASKYDKEYKYIDCLCPGTPEGFLEVKEIIDFEKERKVKVYFVIIDSEDITRIWRKYYFFVPEIDIERDGYFEWRFDRDHLRSGIAHPYMFDYNDPVETGLCSIDYKTELWGTEIKIHNSIDD